MAQGRAAARPQDRCPQPGIPAGSAGEGRVDAALHLLPPLRSELIIDGCRFQAEAQRLLARQDTGLAEQQLPEFGADGERHTVKTAARAVSP
jgi:hypothetical protein